MLEVGIWSGVINRRDFICQCTGLAIIAAALMAATLNSLILSREGTEDPKQIIRPKIAIIAANFRNSCNLI